LRLDSRKARAELGWTTHFGMAQSAAAIVAWHRAWRDGQDMRRFSLAQIAHYEEISA
jgi:CDP-glucose 4,6-dehydratase